MDKFETEYLSMLLKHAKDTRKFLEDSSKPERERSVCRAFLRTIGVNFCDSELIAPTREPADVDFRKARFQVMEMLDRDRRRGAEWKDRGRSYDESASLDTLLEPYSPSARTDLGDLIPDIVKALSKKARKYGAGCADLDALVYVNLEEKFLSPRFQLPELTELLSQRWRSVSLLFPPYGVILNAESTAPDFLRHLVPSQNMKWEDVGALFEAS